MGLAGELEVDTELKTSADKFYKVFSNQVHHVPNASDKVHAIEVHEGDWETAGSIKVWKYTIDGETEEFKEKVTENDEGGGMVKVTLVYEKFKEDDDPPHKFLNYVADIIRDVDAHIINI
ncbi:hypothetical protein JRO89_XS05G0231200 [Xanthoceras sorbifolium]|uniref:Bet v I/Major latex protein domain-containing protein n=1 Tax=Xanthoceras sorbifolium TaxID=99658 RepID=A0ABQ8I2W9_9ROSI|nr:hypothetical protein JRO89_XS05G0231200 [Xanthoceras sorbifolium]